VDVRLGGPVEDREFEHQVTHTGAVLYRFHPLDHRQPREYMFGVFEQHVEVVALHGSVRLPLGKQRRPVPFEGLALAG
jgi:hypothetical protein